MMRKEASRVWKKKERTLRKEASPKALRLKTSLRYPIFVSLFPGGRSNSARGDIPNVTGITP